MDSLSTRTWAVYALLKPVGRSRSAYPDEVTPRGIARRLHAMKREDNWPLWSSPDVQQALRYQLSSHWTRDRLAVLEVIETFLARHEPAQLEAFRHALAQTIVQHPRLWEGLLSVVGSPLQWETPESFMPVQATLSSSTSPYWLDLVERCALANSAAAQAPAAAWISYIHACRLSPNPHDVERLVRLVRHMPALAQVTGHDHDFPLLVAPTHDEGRDAFLMQVFEQAGGDLTRNIDAQPRKRWVVHTPQARMPSFLNHPIPLWSALALWGHAPARAWGQQHGAPDVWDRHVHLEERQQWSRCLGGYSQLHAKFYETHVGTLDDRTDRLLQHLQTSLAWTAPERVHPATAAHPGDVHPVWAAANLYPSVLAKPTGLLAEAWAQRPDLRGATDHEGSNLWWALAQSARYASDVRDAAQRLLVSPVVPCRPNVRGEGLLIRTDGLVGAVKSFSPYTSDSDTLLDRERNPLLKAAQRWPAGVFGQSRTGQTATAEAVAGKLEETLAKWKPGEPLHNASLWHSPDWIMVQWELLQHAPVDADGVWDPLVFALGVLVSPHVTQAATLVDQRLARRATPFPDTWTQRPVLQLALHHLHQAPQLEARWRHLSTAAAPPSHRRVRQRV